jgi:hypothetical protein
MKKQHIRLSILVTVVVLGLISIFIIHGREEEKIQVFWPKQLETNRYLFVPERGTIKDVVKGNFLLIHPFIRDDQVICTPGGRYYLISDLVTDVRQSAYWKNTIQKVMAKASLAEAVTEAAGSAESPEVTEQIIKEIRQSGSLVKGDSRATLEKFTRLSKP